MRCVDDNPWITGAETCELAMALDGLDDHERALVVYADMQRLRHESGSYWTGVVYGDPDKGDVLWPIEHTTYTAAAVILATDALGETSAVHAGRRDHARRLASGRPDLASTATAWSPSRR